VIGAYLHPFVFDVQVNVRNSGHWITERKPSRQSSIGTYIMRCHLTRSLIYLITWTLVVKHSTGSGARK